LYIKHAKNEKKRKTGQYIVKKAEKKKKKILKKSFLKKKKSGGCIYNPSFFRGIFLHRIFKKYVINMSLIIFKSGKISEKFSIPRFFEGFFYIRSFKKCIAVLHVKFYFFSEFFKKSIFLVKRRIIPRKNEGIRGQCFFKKCITSLHVNFCAVILISAKNNFMETAKWFP
jgi:hypothetical protein